MDLIKNKRVVQKFTVHNNYIRRTGIVGNMPRTLFINPSNACNFNCDQCFTSSPTDAPNTAISIDRLRKLSDEADELGIYEIIIEGGEPLFNNDLFEILNSFGSERFYLVITSNGYLLDKNMAARLAEAGVSRVVVSLDSLTPEIHDKYRGVNGAFKHAVEALENVKNAGMQPSVNFLIGHHNTQTDEIEKVCDFCYERHYQMGLAPASPVGNWKGNFDIMMDEDDAKRLDGLRLKYKNVWRDIWPVIHQSKFFNCGCPAVNRAYINPKGDVLPCSYIHIKIGNIYEKSLKEILDYGFSIKYFSQYSNKCLSAEDKIFTKKYLQGNMTVMNPANAQDIFTSDDFFKKEVL